MSKIKFEHVESFKEYFTTQENLQSKCSLLGLEALYLWDWSYWYVSLEDWGEIFRDVLLNLPKYSRRFDCENFALLVLARVTERYGLNTCGVAVGESPFGEHGYNLFAADVDGKLKLFILEPQNGMVYPVSEPEGYKPRLVILG